MATLNENITRIEEAKVAIKNAIIGKGVAVDDTALLDTYASKINQIKQEAGVDFNWETMNYTAEEQKKLNLDYIISYQQSIDYTKQKYSEWDSTSTDMTDKYGGDKKLVICPFIDTSNVTSMEGAFCYCSNLKYVPALNTSNVVSFKNALLDCYQLTEAPNFDTHSGNDFENFLRNCKLIKEIPLYDFSNGTRFCGTFNGLNIETLPLLNTSKAQNMNFFVSNCTSLKSLPLLDMSSVTDAIGMMAGCSQLTSIPQFNTVNLKNASSFLANCSNLTSIPELDFSNVTKISDFFTFESNPIVNEKLTDLGGFKGLKIDFIGKAGLVNCPNLTHQSAVNVLNGLAKVNGKKKQIEFNRTTYDLLSQEEKQIAIDKNWEIITDR